MFDYMKVWEQRYKKDDKGEEMFRRDMDLPMKQPCSNKQGTVG